MCVEVGRGRGGELKRAILGGYNARLSLRAMVSTHRNEYHVSRVGLKLRFVRNAFLYLLLLLFPVFPDSIALSGLCSLNALKSCV